MAQSCIRLALLTLLAAACAAPRPVLYPNPTYAEVGERTAQRDVDECIELAGEFDASPTVRLPEGVTGDVLESATVGAATGGAVGAVVGNAGRGAGAGAAGGVARSLVRGLFRSTRVRSPDTAFHLFVERCLQDRGYELVGWS